MNGKRNRENHKKNHRKNHRKNHYTAIWLPCLLTAAAVTFLLWDGASAGGEAPDSQTVQAYDMAGEDGGSGTGERVNPDGGAAQRGNTGQAGYPGEDRGRTEAEDPAEGTASGRASTSGQGEDSQQDSLNTAKSGETSGRQASPAVRESEQASPPEITLVMVGDILLHTPVAESGRLENGGYDFSAVFTEMKDEIQAADLALVNQEVIIGGEELGVSGYPAFNAPYELGDALADTGFDVALHATNHALDKGKKGIQNCLSFWRENYPDMAVLGIHDSEAAQQEIYVYEQDGIKIAILNYTYGTNGISLPSDMPFAVDMLEKEKVAADLGKARELADFVVVCPHWGTEYVLNATKEQEDWAQFFAENGADLILGTHPHVIEPIMWVAGREAENSGQENFGKEQENSAEGGKDSLHEAQSTNEGTLVYYSLGNFVNWTSGTGEGVANRMVGGMARVTIGMDETGEAVIQDYDVLPLVCHVEQGFGGVTVYPLDEYTEELAARNEIIKQDGSFSLEYCRKLAEEVFGSGASERAER